MIPFRALKVSRVARGGLLGGLLLGLVSNTNAEDLGQQPLAIRLGLALDRASSFSDVVGIGAQTAYPYGSSSNPAAGDFLREPPQAFTWTGTVTSVLVSFGGGASATAAAGTASYRFPAGGTLIVGYSRSDSHDGLTHQGDHITLRADEVRASYSHLLAPGISLGGGMIVRPNTLKFRSTDFDFPLQTETDSLELDGSLGILFAPGPQWLVGASGAIGWTRSETTGKLLLPEDPFGPGPLRIAFTENLRSAIARVGVGWRPVEQIGVYVDGQYLQFTNDHLGQPRSRVEVGRLFAGVEGLPVPALALRVGMSADTFGQTGISTGFGFYGIKNVQIEFAYVYNAFPEIRKEFGRAHLLTLGVVAIFP